MRIRNSVALVLANPSCCALSNCPFNVGWIGNEIATNIEADRPGMIVVRKLPTGEYFMSYEVCGDPLTGHKCAAYYRTSRDGWSYGRAR
jgi:hypothetical protein